MATTTPSTMTKNSQSRADSEAPWRMDLTSWVMPQDWPHKSTVSAGTRKVSSIRSGSHRFALATTWSSLWRTTVNCKAQWRKGQRWWDTPSWLVDESLHHEDALSLANDYCGGLSSGGPGPARKAHLDHRLGSKLRAG